MEIMVVALFIAAGLAVSRKSSRLIQNEYADPAGLLQRNAAVEGASTASFGPVTASQHISPV